MVDSNDLDPQDAAPYEPTDEEIAQMLASSSEERAAAQALVLRECSDHWQKVAKIVGDLLAGFEQTYPHLPFAFLQATMQKLEDLGKVEIVGDVWAMRYSEIRLAKPSPGTA
jgi:hypothetical protein